MKIYIIILCFFSSAMMAQNAPYKGGYGDGFASNKLVLKSISLSVSVVKNELKIYKSESFLFVQHAMEYKDLEIYTIQGALLHREKIGEDNNRIAIAPHWINQQVIIVLRGNESIAKTKMSF
ncbi:MAG: hypothetical protein IPK03_03150 [Bacteroidetes bacterium]|nr:hypothetical protein [Bacteroidota bacterium]